MVFWEVLAVEHVFIPSFSMIICLSQNFLVCIRTFVVMKISVLKGVRFKKNTIGKLLRLLNVVLRFLMCCVSCEMRFYSIIGTLILKNVKEDSILPKPASILIHAFCLQDSLLPIAK